MQPSAERDDEASVHRALVRALTGLWRARDLDEIAGTVCPAARQILDADGATLVLKDGDGCKVINEDTIAPLWPGERRLRHGAWMIEQDEPLVIEDLHEDQGLSGQDFRDSYVRGLTVIPVRGERLQAALICSWAGPGFASVGQLAMLHRLAGATAAAIEAQRERDDLERKAREREAARDDARSFVAAVSHGIRTPVAQVIGFAQLLHDEKELLVPGHAGFVEEILAAARHANVLIEALGKLARVIQSDLHVVPLDLGTIAGEIAADLAQRAPDRQIEWDLPSGLEARGDERLLRSLLEHLLGNAVKFTAGREPARIEIGALAGSTFYVRDNGVGFDPRQKERLFTPFGWLHARDEFPGLGLGLATCRRILELHGGRIWAEGQPGQGATFLFSLA
jgi:signal transduction histidine kinase